MLAIAIMVIGSFSAIVQLFYCFYFFYRFDPNSENLKGATTHMSDLPPHALIPFSVIICAKNEAHNLRRNLPAVLSQCYSDEQNNRRFEVIVVNDASTDDTGILLDELQQSNSHLSVVTIAMDEPRYFPGKKFPLSKGVAAATYAHLLMTDADCSPVSQDWIRWMAYPFSRGKHIVAGYGGYKKRRGILNAFIRWETLHTYLQYLSYNLAGIPYMAVGRNLACEKDLLLQVQLAEEWSRTPSGDDDLLIQLSATCNNMSVNVHPASFTLSEAKRSWRAWIAQKQRHVSTGKLYKRKVQLLSGIYALTHALSWIVIVLAITTNISTTNISHECAAVFSATLLFTSRVLISLRRAEFYGWMGQGSIFWVFFPFLDFGWALYNLFFAPYILWKNKKTWK